MNVTTKRGKSKDAIVSVRLPKSLVEELKILQKKNHFLDISDELRYIVRKNSFALSLKFFNTSNSSSSGKFSEKDAKVLQNSFTEIFEEKKKKEKLVEDLSGILDELKKEKHE